MQGRIGVTLPLRVRIRNAAEDLRNRNADLQMLRKKDLYVTEHDAQTDHRVVLDHGVPKIKPYISEDRRNGRAVEGLQIKADLHI